MFDTKTAPYAALLLRLSLSIMFIAHSVYLKAFVYTLPGTAQFFASMGLPPFLAYIVFVTEVVGGVLLLLGFGTRWAAIALLPILLGAAWAHWPNGWVFTAPNGGWEDPMFLAAAALVQSLLGDGAYALRLHSRSVFDRVEMG